MNDPTPIQAPELAEPMTLSVEPYISESYARAERDLLWAKVWQVACREEEIPNVGDFYSYEIQDQSIVVVRSAPDEISAYHNVCRHRGRRLTKGCGHATRFRCAYHGWQYKLDGSNLSVQEREDWQGALDNWPIDLAPVKVGRWSGFVFINMDPDCEPLEDYLDPVNFWLDPFDLGGMRYAWRKQGKLAANWKTVIEAFSEGYHAIVTHPQTMQFGMPRTWSGGMGKHGLMRNTGVGGGGIGTSISEAKAMDPRAKLLGAVRQQRETTGSLTTDTFIAAAEKVMDVLTETATPQEVAMTFMQLAREMDAERGVIWPNVDPMHQREAGINWSVFPNTVLLQNVTFCFGFRIRPDGFNPDSCIIEIYHLERFPEGQEPKPEVQIITENTVENWKLLVFQDLENLEEIQKGMKSISLNRVVPNPFSENSVVNLQRSLAHYMGRAEPKPYGAS